MGRHRVIGGTMVSLSFRSGSVFSGSGNPHTVTGADIGAAGKRHVIVAIWTSGANVTGVTIGGVTATLIHSLSGPCFYGAFVPTGTTANIVLSGGGLFGSIGLAVWAVYNLKSLSAIDTVTNASTISGDTLTAKPRGCAFALAVDGCAFDQTPASFSISGMTKDAEPLRMGPPNIRLLFASALTPATSLTYTASPIANSLGTADIIISASLR
jgi:hypothetical protein